MSRADVWGGMGAGYHDRGRAMVSDFRKPPSVSGTFGHSKLMEVLAAGVFFALPGCPIFI